MAPHAAADIDSVVRTAADRQYGPSGRDLLASDAFLQVRNAILEEPAILNRTETFWLPTAGGLDLAAKSEGTPADEQPSMLQSMLVKRGSVAPPPA